MKPLVCALCFLTLPGFLCGQDGTPQIRQGADALAAGLWEVAALHFQQALASPSLSAADRANAATQLAQAWIRGGKPAAALEVLDQSLVKAHPATAFWKGQALTAMGRFNDAAAAFQQLLEDPAAAYRNEASLTLASLQLALDQSDAALASLEPLVHSSDATVAVTAQLQQVAILLDLQRPEAARAAMPAAAAVGPAQQPLATFLNAQLLLRRGDNAAAAAAFQELIDKPTGQSLHRYHAAAVGLADALRAQSDPDAAVGFLLAFIDDHPQSPLLGELFARLQACLPETPALSDPLMEHLAAWSPPGDAPVTGAINTLECSAATAWPTASAPPNELVAYALYTRALALRKIANPAARGEARQLLTRLWLENPTHPLASHALFLKARWALDDNNPDLAFSILDTLRESAQLPPMRGAAAFLEAHTRAAQGDSTQAIALFDEAAQSLTDQQAGTARFNAAVLRLTNTAAPSPVPVLQPAPPLNPTLAADLELERALVTPDPEAARRANEAFLAHYPNHPRVAEARMAAAEAALASPQPDLEFARSQLAALTAAAEPAGHGNSARVDLLRLRIEDLSKDTTATIATARSILADHPNDPAAAEAALVLGRNLFQSRNYNEARLVLQKLATTDTDPARAQAAGLLAARAAALVPTTQSQQEALLLFDKVITSKGSLAAIARLEQARLMIDMNRLSEAATSLRTWFATLSPKDPLHLPAGLLLGEAIYAQGSANPDSLTQALAIYDELLAHCDQQPAVFNRLQYLRGRTLEQIPDASDPSRKSDNLAFIAYYSVLENAAPPAEWHYFELCGFRALALLEKAGRWPAAIACAQRIASFHGPRANEAAARASQLQLTHMIWED